MKLVKAYKFRLKTNLEIEQKLAQYSGCCRFVWNKALATQKERLNERKFWLEALALNGKNFGYGKLTYTDMAARLVSWKKDSDTNFLGDCPSQPLQQTLRDLDRALNHAFNKRDPRKFPVFKKKGKRDSFRFPVSYKNEKPSLLVEDKRVKIPKLGWVHFFRSRKINGLVKNVTISNNNGHWYVSFQVEENVAIPVHSSDSRVGIDLGVANFATLSNGDVFSPTNPGKKISAKIVKQQRVLSRKVKFSSNWKKHKKCLNKLHQKIKNRRQNFLHKISSRISKNHAVIYLEKLNVKSMSKSAKGTTNNPGKNVKIKSNLNKSILDQGWYEFRRQLEYKSIWLGGEVHFVDPRNTSRKCPVCGYTHKQNRKTQENFVCMFCGFKENADYVAALNILAAGQAVSACGDSALAESVKQEPVKDCEVMSPQILN